MFIQLFFVYIVNYNKIFFTIYNLLNNWFELYKTLTMYTIDLINFNYSVKDTSICNRKYYMTKIFNQTTKFIRWIAFLNEMHSNNIKLNSTDYIKDEELHVYGSKIISTRNEKNKSI